jgi:hypothetical protein
VFGVHVGLGRVPLLLSQKENKHLKRFATALEHEGPSEGASDKTGKQRRGPHLEGGAGGRRGTYAMEGAWLTWISGFPEGRGEAAPGGRPQWAGPPAVPTVGGSRHQGVKRYLLGTRPEPSSPPAVFAQGRAFRN